jgi:hypothetical protein
MSKQVKRSGLYAVTVLVTVGAVIGGVKFSAFAQDNQAEPWDEEALVEWDELEEVDFADVDLLLDAAPLTFDIGACPAKFVLSQTNGEPYTITLPKNIGTCELALISFDIKGKVIPGTVFKIKPGVQKLSYISKRGAHRVGFACSKFSGGPGTCILEIERPTG